MFQWPIVNANTRQIDHALMLQMHAGSIIWHTCQPETPKKTEIFGLICFITPHGPAGSRHLSGKQHNPILERLDSQHASFFAGIKKSLYDFQNISSLYWKRLTLASQLSLEGTGATVVNSILRQHQVRQGCILIHIFNLSTHSVIREA